MWLGIAALHAAPGAAPEGAPGLAERIKVENLDKLSIYDAAVLKIRAGKQLTEKEIDECDVKFRAYFDELAEKNGVRDNAQFPQDDQFDFYVTAVKLALIDFPDHGGWPFRSTLRLTVQETLKERTENTEDSFLLFCAIFPSLSKGDVEHAALCYKKLRKSDEFLTKTTDGWLAEYFLNEKVKADFKKAAGIE